MSVLDRLKNLIKTADEDIDKSLTKETVPTEEAADSIQTSSEEEKEIKSDSETNSDETSKVEVPVEEEVIVPIHAETPEEAEPEEDEEDVDEVAEAEEAEETPEAEIEESGEEAIEETEEEVSVEETPEEAVEEVPEEEVSLESDEEIQEEVEESLDDSEVEEESDEEESSEENEESDNMTLLKENDVYSMDDIDKEFTQKFIDAGIETVDHCFQCGTCGGGCPSGRRTPYRVRQVVRKCLLGLREEVVSDPALWMCTTCYTCQERCPRSVKIVDIIKMARNEAAKAGYMADAHKATGSFVIKTGHGVPINDKTKELRTAIGLSELPPTVHAYPEALEEVQKICVACDFDKLIGYNMETGSLE
ncbi:CoB--CoM heterodisulfide reductase subunit C [uncultured Methanobrevibacter sp.]|uniref:CoB--CoM heterodisulfide reductase subunit C n=1 Tax=uncultured Methanobrevibacter sp. TaxID=253161 RepID=UPI0026062E79